MTSEILYRVKKNGKYYFTFLIDERQKYEISKIWNVTEKTSIIQIIVTAQISMSTQAGTPSRDSCINK